MRKVPSISGYDHIYTQNMPGMDDRPSSIKGVREDIQVSKQQIY
jgi:hypothetical protein